jgi:hypothetical protein
MWQLQKALAELRANLYDDVVEVDLVLNELIVFRLQSNRVFVDDLKLIFDTFQLRLQFAAPRIVLLAPLA